MCGNIYLYLLTLFLISQQIKKYIPIPIYINFHNLIKNIV